MIRRRSAVLGATAIVLAALALPIPAGAGEIRWYVGDADDVPIWEAMTQLVARGTSMTVRVWAEGWPPRPGVPDGGVDVDEPSPSPVLAAWDCWLVEEPDAQPTIVVAMDGRPEHLEIPLESAGTEREQRVRAAVLLTLSPRVELAISPAPR